MNLGTRQKLFLISCALILLCSLVVSFTLRSGTPAAAVGVAVLLALVSAAAFSAAASRLTAQAVGELTREAQRMAEGEPGSALRAQKGGVFDEVAGALDKLARNLSGTLDELRSERDRMRGIMGAMQEGLLLLDNKGKIMLLNPALREMLLLGHDAVGKTLLEVVRHAELKELLDHVRESGESDSIEIELGGLKPRRLLVRAGLVANQRQAVLTVFVDVTERRRLESIRRDFVANVSHELRTPVTAVRSAAETLANGAPTDSETLKRFIGIIERNAERLHLLVEDLLDLSRIESREYRVTIEPLELKSVVAQVLGLLRDRGDAKKMELLNDVGESQVLADRRALEHVVTNLIDNAIKYCGQGSFVRLRSVDTKESVELVVEDNGPGIEAKHLPRIFERFYRVDPGRSRELGGTGLGLSIVKHLVEAMSGRIAVESTPGTGTHFSIWLKRSTEATDVARQVA